MRLRGCAAALSVKYLAAVVGSLAMAEYLSGAMFLFGSARRAASGFQARADLKLLVYGLGASRRVWLLLNQFQLDSLSFVAVEQDRPQLLHPANARTLHVAALYSPTQLLFRSATNKHHRVKCM